MVNQPPQRAGPAWNHVDPKLAGALERAARAIARLDQSLNGHPLLPAFLYRARLEAEIAGSPPDDRLAMRRANLERDAGYLESQWMEIGTAIEAAGG